jgi:hypothetical protein
MASITPTGVSTAIRYASEAYSKCSNGKVDAPVHTQFLEMHSNLTSHVDLT